ncbi:hypothetical protein [Anaerotignum sp.]
MKKRIFAVLFAMMMLAGCGGADEHEDHDHAEGQKQEVAADDAASQFLQSLPAEFPEESAVSEGFFTINDGVVSNQEVWDAFAEFVENGEEAEVVVCQYTTKGGAVLDYVTHHADGTIEVVTDTTRDGYNDEKSILKPVETYTDLKVFENFSLQEGGTAYTVCVLSDNPELTADDFRTHWINMTAEENHIYMLFVI